MTINAFLRMYKTLREKTNLYNYWEISGDPHYDCPIIVSPVGQIFINNTATTLYVNDCIDMRYQNGNEDLDDYDSGVKIIFKNGDFIFFYTGIGSFEQLCGMFNGKFYEDENLLEAFKKESNSYCSSECIYFDVKADAAICQLFEIPVERETIEKMTPGISNNICCRYFQISLPDSK